MGGGRWRYDYAVMNLDFARAVTQGAEPNLKVLSHAGFNSFSLPVGRATLTDLRFSDGDLDATNDWPARIAGGRITWTAPNLASALNWGTMFRFSFVTTQAPGRGSVTLGVANAGTPAALQSTTLPTPGTAASPATLSPVGVAAPEASKTAPVTSKTPG